MELRREDKQLEEFARLLAQFDAPSFMGLAKVLCVYVFDNNKLDDSGKPMPREAEEIIKDCILAFGKLNRKKRREIIQIMRRVVKNK